MTAKVDVQQVVVRYGATTAVDRATFTLHGDTIVGLLGRNGSGKSSLLSVLAAFRKASDGVASFNGRPIFESPASVRHICLIRELADTVEQSERVVEALRVAAKHRPFWDRAYADTLCRRFDVPFDKKLGELSRGKRAALGIVLGLASRAPLTMFDESYLGLDAPSRRLFYDELLADYARHPRTFIISTHLIEEIAPLFEEVLIIDRGRVVRHEFKDRLLEQGIALTGRVEEIDRLIDGRTVMEAKQLGQTKSVKLYGDIDGALLERANRAGVSVEPVTVEDIFIHLTQPEGAHS